MNVLFSLREGYLSLINVSNRIERTSVSAAVFETIFIKIWNVSTISLIHMANIAFIHRHTLGRAAARTHAHARRTITASAATQHKHSEHRFNDTPTSAANKTLMLRTDPSGRTRPDAPRLVSFRSKRKRCSALARVRPRGLYTPMIRAYDLLPIQ